MAALCALPCSAGQMSSGTFTVIVNDANSGGGTASSGNASTITTVGQTTSIGPSTNSTSQVGLGYIYTLAISATQEIDLVSIEAGGIPFSAKTIIPSTETLQVTLSDIYPISTVSLVIDSGTTLETNTVLSSLGRTGTVETWSGKYVSSTSLLNHTLTLYVADSNGANASYAFLSQLQSSTMSFHATGKPRNVPNPFKTGTGKGTTIIYKLQSNTDVKFIVYDISGRAVWTRFFNSGVNGGKAGDNTVFWDGTTDMGQAAGNGVYIYVITTKGRILSKGQMAVMD